MELPSFEVPAFPRAVEFLLYQWGTWGPWWSSLPRTASPGKPEPKPASLAQALSTRPSSCVRDQDLFILIHTNFNCVKPLSLGALLSVRCCIRGTVLPDHAHITHGVSTTLRVPSLGLITTAESSCEASDSDHAEHGAWSTNSVSSHFLF